MLHGPPENQGFTSRTQEARENELALALPALEKPLSQQRGRIKGTHFSRPESHAVVSRPELLGDTDSRAHLPCPRFPQVVRSEMRMLLWEIPDDVVEHLLDILGIGVHRFEGLQVTLD